MATEDVETNSVQRESSEKEEADEGRYEDGLGRRSVKKMFVIARRRRRSKFVKAELARGRRV